MEVKVRKKICEFCVTIKKISIWSPFENFSICYDKIFYVYYFFTKVFRVFLYYHYNDSNG